MLDLIDTLSKIIIPVVTVLIAGAISALVSYFSTHKQLSAQYKTNKRIEWIQEIRVLTAEFIAYSLDLYNYANTHIGTVCSGEEKSNRYFQINTRAIQLKLLLNPCDCRDKQLVDALNTVIEQVSDTDNGMSRKRLFDALDTVQALTSVYLKDEWERCKNEIDGKEYQANKTDKTKMSIDKCKNEKMQIAHDDGLGQRYAFAQKYNASYAKHHKQLWSKPERFRISSIIDTGIIVLALVSLGTSFVLVEIQKTLTLFPFACSLFGFLFKSALILQDKGVYQLRHAFYHDHEAVSISFPFHSVPRRENPGTSAPPVLLSF